MITAGPDASLWKQLVKQWDGRTPSGSVFVHGPVLRRTLRFFERLEELVLEVSAKKNGKPRENVTDLVVELERILRGLFKDWNKEISVKALIMEKQ